LRKRLVINNKIAYREIEGQILFLRPDDHMLLTLNATGKFVWEGIEKKKGLEKIVENFSKKFKVSEDQARKDVEHFVRDLKNKKIIIESKASCAF
jgi:hypothetical protein